MKEVLKYIIDNDLHRILKFYGGERQSRTISNAIIDHRSNLRSLNRTTDLTDLISSKFGKSYSTGCVFQVTVNILNLMYSTML